MSVSNPHRRAELRSLAMHAHIADRLGNDGSLLRFAVDEVARWREQGGVDAFYVDAWSETLRKPTPDLIALLTADTERGRDLRQVSPFVGLIDPRTRWRILEAFNSKSVSESG